MTQKERMIAGELYQSGDPELVADRRSCRLLLHRYNHSTVDDVEERKAILGELLPHVGANFTVEPPFYCDYGYNIRTGANVYFNFDCVVLDVASVTIGRDVMFASKVQLITATHPLDHKFRNELWELGKPITIGDEVWVGAGAIILPGVSVGARTVIGAGAIVTKDVPPDTVVAGNPAKVIRRLGG